MEPVAIIGAAHRFPGGANTPSKLWELLNSGSDLSQEPQKERLNLSKFYHPNGDHHGCTPVTKSYFLEEDPRLFDAAFFNISPIEAEAMDPQQRLLLETVYEASETAGVGLRKLRGSRCSVFVGVMNGDYSDMQARDPEDLSPYTASGTSRAILANRISYYFDLSGSSICLDTACSSSLVAMHLAVQDLRNGTADTAIVAGCNLIFGPDMYISESKLHMLSPTGTCKMWDAGADGYARGEGIAALFLKPLSQAVRDGDAIQAVVRNSGVNSDGRTPGITMPSSTSQASLIRQTYNAVGLDPLRRHEDRCQYFEAHGTGTQAGDPAEAKGIFESFFPSDSEKELGAKPEKPLLVGSIKTVLGHLEGCAGLAGIIKVLLAMKHNIIPPNLHMTTLNPKISSFTDVLNVPTKALPWPLPALGQPKRASVNSFGFGGTNAHVILESYEPIESSLSSIAGDEKEESLALPLTISANSQSSLLESVRRMASYLRSHPDTALNDIAWTLWARQNGLAFRKSFSGNSRESFLSDLDRAAADTDTAQPSMGISPRSLMSPSEGFGVLGIFTGQGAQWSGMGRDLILHNPIFRRAIEQCDEALSSLDDAPSWTLKSELLADSSSSRLSEAEIAQPTTTAIEIGLVDVLASTGIHFSTVVGHSSGEIAALYAAGILSLTDAIRIAFYRGVYANLAGEGAMMAVGLGADAAMELCNEDRFRGRIFLAAKNSPSSITLSGDVDAVREAKAVFDQSRVFARVLRTDKAYHSRHMEACGEAYLQAMRKCSIKPQAATQCVWVSSVSGNADRWWDRDFDTLTGEYWVENMIKPVLFADAVTSALTNSGLFDVAIEVGPHAALKGPVNQTVQPHLHSTIPYVGAMNRDENCVESISRLVGFLWSNFESSVVDFAACQRAWYNQPRPAKVVDDLPPYSWDHSRAYWRESRVSRNHRLRPGGNDSVLLGHRCPDDTDWEPRWRNFLSLKELPWFRGHSFQGEVLFPAAGYVVMVLEVAQFLAGDRPVFGVEISDLTFERTTSLHDGPRPVEFISSVKITHAAKDLGPARDGTLEAEFSCSVCSDPATAALERTCFGKLTIHFDPRDDDLLPPRIEPFSATSPVDIDRFYASIRAIGLEYEGAFKGLKSIRRADGVATARASWHVDEIEYGNLHHPGLLDTALQTLFAAFTAPTTDKLWTAYLPQTFKKIVVNPHRQFAASADQKVELVVDAYLVESLPTKLVGNLDLYSFEDNCRYPLVQFEGLALAALKRPDASNDRIIFSETRWEADLLGGADFPIDYNPPQEALVVAAERVALFFSRKVLEEADRMDVQQLKWHEKLFVAEIRKIVEMTRNGTHESCEKEWLDDNRSAVDAILERYKHQSDFELLRRVGDEIGPIFHNDKQLVQVLFKDDKLGEFYREGLGLRNAQRQIATYMRAISHRYPKANILELGAGTGATTAPVLSSIGHDYGSYVFTDVSAGFFPEAQDRFADHADRMAFRKLDISAPFEGQGFEKHSFDVIIAASVLHIAEDVTVALQRVRGLLKPGGFLVAHEPTSTLLRDQLIFGGFEGWWLAKDDCRISGPVMTMETWDEKLRSAGFSGVDKMDHDQIDVRLRTCTSFISQAVSPTFDAVRNPLEHMHLMPESAQFMLIGGSTLRTSKIVRSIRVQLSTYGHQVIHFPDMKSIKWTENESFRPYVLCLAELDQPTFRGRIDNSLLGRLQVLTENSSAIQVITRNAGSTSPFSNAMTGLCRGLRSEKPSRPVQIIDMDGSSTLEASALLEHFMCLVFADILKIGAADNCLWTFETELCMRNNNLFVPRIREYSELNDRLNSRRRAISRDVSKESHILEVRSLSSGYQLAARANIGHLQNPDLVAVHVELSTLLPLSVLSLQTPHHLCFVRLQNHPTNHALALTEINASSLQVPPKQIYPISEGHTFSSETLGIMAICLAVQSWVRVVPCGSVIWVHGAEDSVMTMFEEVAQKKGVRIFSTSAEPSDPNYVHPNTSSHIIKSIVPEGISALIVGGSSPAFDKFSSKFQSEFGLPGSLCGSLNACPGSWPEDSYPSRLLADAYAIASTWSYPAHIRARSRVVLLEKFASTLANGVQHVLDWSTATTVRAKIEPFDTKQLFNPNKTYLLVGLTGDVGLSICTWMVKHGVRHIVLASRHPQVNKQWLGAMDRRGANVVVKAMDVTEFESIRQTVTEINKTMPPIAGVCNGAMILSDKLFKHMDTESMNGVLQPKIDGSINLDKVFSNAGLDFFIMLSSTASVIGTPGQTPYHMSNMFMTALAADRRSRGLAGSAIDVGMISEIGYVTRQDVIVERNLRSMNILSLCEEDIHIMFAEGILAGRPDSGRHPELIAGLKISDNENERPFWATEPRFAFYVKENRAADMDNANGSSPIDNLQMSLKTATDENSIVEIIRAALAKRLESLLQLPADSLNMSMSLMSLGMDSLLAMEVQSWFGKIIGAEISLLQILGGASGELLCKAAAKSVFAMRGNVPESRATNTLSTVSTEKDGDTSTGSENLGDTSSATGSSSGIRTISPPPSTINRKQQVIRQGPMSFGQAPLWFLQGFLEDETTYNETAMYEIYGPLDAKKLEVAFRQVTSHHEIMRTRFYTDQETEMHMQGVLATSACPFRHLEDASDETVAVEYKTMTTRVWDLENGVCMGITLLRHSADKHTLILGAHHMVVDGMSWVLILKNLSRAYKAEALPLVPQYLDFTAAQHQLVASGNVSNEIVYWKNQLAGLPEALPLFPMSYIKTRKALNRYDTAVVKTKINANTVSQIKNICSRLLITPFHFHLSVLMVLVSRLSQTSDVCIGTVDSGRSDSKYAETLGFFINIVPIRVNVNDEDTFMALSQNTSKKVFSALSNSRLPLDALLDELRVSRTARYAPLFQIVINYRLGTLDQNTIGDCKLQYLASKSSGNPHDICVNITESQDGTCLLDIDIQEALYSRQAGQSILDSYCQLLESACQSPQSPLAELKMTQEFSVTELTKIGRGPRIEFNWAETISLQIDKVAAAQDRNIAIKDDSKTYTYGQLMQKVNNIAAALHDTGIAEILEPCCCLVFEPSVDYIAALLAVLKIGAVAVSLDPANHRQRLAAIMEDCKPSVILLHEHTADLAQWLYKTSASSTIRSLNVSPPPLSTTKISNVSTSSAPAVIFYTSGTTGKPKGAVLKHSNYRYIIAAATSSMCIKFGYEVIVQQTPVTFDMCLLKIFIALANAGTIVIASKHQQKDPLALASLFAEHKVSVLMATPSEFSMLYQHAFDTLKQCSSLNTVALGGEIFSHQLATQICQVNPNIAIYNLYGPTECGIMCAAERIESPIDTNIPYIPVGPPLANTTVYILDKAQSAVAPGCTGEVYIAGSGVGRGYLRQPDMTSRVFLPDPFASAEDVANGWTTMYRTGDLGFVRENGALVILGRIDSDSQVKIRGVRIELDDVASNILNHSGGKFAQAVVTARGDGDQKMLVGFAVLASGVQLDNEQTFFDQLASSLPLPEYMRPAMIVPVVQFPITSNGKLDRAALNKIPLPSRKATSSPETLLALENDLRLLWQSLLPITNGGIYPESDFFRLGGNSMLLVRLRKGIQKKWSISVQLLQLFEASTLLSMASLIRGTKDKLSGGSDWEFWDQETKFELPVDVEGVTSRARKATGDGKNVLLTGANMYLGSQLLQHLLSHEEVSKVYCVAVSSEQLARLPKSEKLVVYQGSLGDAHLGLSEEAQSQLCSSTDVIIHAGAEGSCLNNYASISTPNVNSTKFLARLALTHKIPIHFISSSRVILFSGQNAYPEASVSQFYPPLEQGREGFTTTKWASERYLEDCARATGLPITIHRTGYLISDDADEMDTVNMILKYSPLLKAVPNMKTFRGWLDLCDLHEVAEQLATTLVEELGTTASAPENGQAKFVHHTHDNVVPIEEFQPYMEKRTGTAMECLPMTKWAAKAEEEGMNPFLAAFLEAVGEKDEEARYPRLLHGSGDN